MELSCNQRRRQAMRPEPMSRASVFNNSLRENGEVDWACPLCGFTNRPRTFECNLCGLDRDKLLLEEETVRAASRELMEGKVVTAMRLSDRQLRAARRLLWSRELRQIGLREGYISAPTGAYLQNWCWVRNSPPPPRISSEDTALSKSMQESYIDVESGGKASMYDNTDDPSYGPQSPRRRGNPLFNIFGKSESRDSLQRTLIDTNDSDHSFSSPSPNTSYHSSVKSTSVHSRTKSPGRPSKASSLFAVAKSLFTKPPPKPLVLDSVTQFAFVAVPVVGDKIRWVSVVDNEVAHLESQHQNAETVDAAFSELYDDFNTEELLLVCLTAFRDKHRWFEEQIDRLQIPWARGHITVHVSRENLLETSMNALHKRVEVQDLRMFMRVNFVGEPGIDVGGILREWFLLTLSDIFSPEEGLFEFPVGSSGYRINPCGGGYEDNKYWIDDHSLDIVQFAGKLLGKALFERQAINIRLTTGILKHMLGAPCTLADLVDLDPELAKHISWLLEQPPHIIDSLDLDFTVNMVVPQSSFSSVSSMSSKKKPKKSKKPTKVSLHELKPGGEQITVTSENLQEYVVLLSQWHLGKAVEKPLSRFLEGFYSVVPPDILTVFDYAELEFIMCGSQTVDVEDWKRHTDYVGEFSSHGYGPTKLHPVCVWFWEVVTDMSESDRLKLFQFATGGSKVPAQGFKALQRNDGKYQTFTLESADPSQTEGWLPVSHTCFNRIDLPVYQNKTKLREALQLIVSLDVSGFSMD